MLLFIKQCLLMFNSARRVVSKRVHSSVVYRRTYSYTCT